MSASQRLQDQLPQFDHSDDVFKALLTDPDATPTTDPPVYPMDYNTGGVGSLLDYTEQLSQDLIDQSRADQAESEFLLLILQDFLGIPIMSGESDADYLTRATNTVFGPKCTPPAIIDAVVDYSTPGEPTIVNDTDYYRAYSGHSYAGVDSLIQISASHIAAEVGDWIFPARSVSDPALAFHFILIMQNTEDADALTVIAIVDEIIAAGITWELYVINTASS